MKNDEKEFLKLCIEQCGWNSEQRGITPRDIINSKLTTINHKRAYYLLDKWSRKYWYEYGVTLDLGWFVDYIPGKKAEIESILAP